MIPQSPGKKTQTTSTTIQTGIPVKRGDIPRLNLREIKHSNKKTDYLYRNTTKEITSEKKVSKREVEVSKIKARSQKIKQTIQESIEHGGIKGADAFIAVIKNKVLGGHRHRLSNEEVNNLVNDTIPRLLKSDNWAFQVDGLWLIDVLRDEGYLPDSRIKELYELTINILKSTQHPLIKANAQKLLHNLSLEYSNIFQSSSHKAPKTTEQKSTKKLRNKLRKAEEELKDVEQKTKTLEQLNAQHALEKKELEEKIALSEIYANGYEELLQEQAQELKVLNQKLTEKSNKFKQKAESVQAQLAQLQQKNTQLQSTAKSNQQLQQQQIQDLEIQNLELAKKGKDLQQEADKVKAQLEKLQQESIQLQSVTSNNQQLQQQAQELEALNQKLTEKSNDLKQEADRVKEQLAQLQLENAQLQGSSRSNQQLQQQMQELETQNQELSKKSKGFEEEADRVNAELEKLQQENARLNTEFETNKQLQKQINELKDAEIANKRASEIKEQDHQQEIDTLKAALDKLKIENVALQDNNEKLTQDNNTVRGRLKTLQELYRFVLDRANQFSYAFKKKLGEDIAKFMSGK